MRINFSLEPIESIGAWGPTGAKHLHWYGLTDGHYWIDVGNDSLFEYSQVAVDKYDAPSHCAYQVARLHMDLIELLPFSLNPVPKDLIPLISGETAKSWNERRVSWFEENEGRVAETRFLRIVESSSQWSFNRHLDAAYLRFWPKIIIWSDETTVHVEWDNRDRLIEGCPVWSASVGSYSLPRTEFVASIESFHSRLMEQMELRVSQIVSGAQSAGCEVDLKLLLEEQKWRSESLQAALESRSDASEWQSVRDAIEIICSDTI